MQQLLQEAFSDRAQSELKEIVLQLNGETQRTIWDKPSRIGFNTFRIGLNGPLSEKMKSKGFIILDSGNRLGTFEPAGIGQAMDEVFKDTPCQQA